MTKEKLLTAKEFAKIHNVSRSSVTSWCRAGKIPGAFLEQTPFGEVWYIPESSSANFVKPEMGRPRKSSK